MSFSLNTSPVASSVSNTTFGVSNIKSLVSRQTFVDTLIFGEWSLFNLQNLMLLLGNRCLNKLVLDGCSVSADLADIIEYLIKKRGLSELEIANIQYEHLQDEYYPQIVYDKEQKLIEELYEVLSNNEYHGMLSPGNGLEILEIRGRLFSITPEFIKNLLENNNTMHTLVFSQLSLSSDWIVQIQDSLAKGTALRSLMFVGCYINIGSSNSLSDLVANVDLDRLVVCDCAFPAKSDFPEFATGLVQSKALKAIYLENIRVDPSLAEKLAQDMMSVKSILDWCIVDDWYEYGYYAGNV